MQAWSAELIVAVAGAALLGALAYRQLTSTLIQLNNELQEAIQERRAGESEREILRTRIAELETQVGQLETRLERQSRELQELQGRLKACDELVTLLRTENSSVVVEAQH